MTAENEISEMWRDHKKACQEKKRANESASTQILDDHSIKFESKNGGNHLIVPFESGNLSGSIDFWPSTGKWIVRNGRKGRGVRNLIKLVQSDNPITKE